VKITWSSGVLHPDLNAEERLAVSYETQERGQILDSQGRPLVTADRVSAFGVVPGLGSHVSWDQRLDGRLAQALVSIQAIKGVAIGEGVENVGRPGSEALDEIFWSEERGWHRETNRAGGIEGGMTNGEPLVCRVMMKPLPTLTQPLR
jgi:chorismate synthase